MKNWTKKFAVLAGLAALSVAGQAALLDGKIELDRAVNSPTLTVRYTGVKATMIELKLNGKSLATRTVGGKSASGETNFALDLGKLEEGDNLVEVFLYDDSGKLVGTQQTIVSAEAGRAGDAYLSVPKSGQSVMGPVEIKLGLNRDFREMYVSFFVNDEWKSMRNFPPYSYLWDTTRETNGWHEIQAWVVDDANNTFKTKKIKVFVNNPGGRTDRRGIIAPILLDASPNLTPRGTEASGTVGIRSTVAQPVAAQTSANALAPREAATVKAAQPAVAATQQTTPKVQVQTPVRVPVDLNPSANSLSPVLAEATVGVRNSVDGVVALAPAKTTVTTPKPGLSISTLPAVGRVGSAAGLKQSTLASSMQMGPRLLAPTGTRNAVATTASLPKVGPSVKVAQQAATQLALVAVGKGTKLPNVGTFTVLLNSKIVEFDVQPKVQNGLPIAPFRILMEQNGGKVKWEHASKTVSAEKSGKKIVLQIGKSAATVDGKKTQMEVMASLDGGRTLVPLSFLKESMNVDVQYDPNTGQILINSKK